MSSFTSFDGELNIEYAVKASQVLRKDYWVTKKAFTYYVNYKNSNLSVTIPIGFLSDGASVPFVIRGLIPAMGAHSQAAVLHDYLCETYKVKKTKSDGTFEYINVNRAEIDSIFYEALSVVKFPKWKILLIRLGVDAYRLIANPKKPKVSKEKLQLEKEYNICHEHTGCVQP